MLLAPGPASAFHALQAGWDAAYGAGAYRCYDCHTLNGQTNGEGVVGTSFIAYSSRTMPLIIAYNGGTAPANLGCTYCHNTPGNTRMRDALSHFGAKTSKHPVGKNFVTGVETNREYLSSASTAVTATPEIDCVDCHNEALISSTGTYVDHGTIPASNPFLLKSVTVADNYDNLCRICHGSAAATFKGQNVRVTSHADASAGGQIQEMDGTLLKTAGGNNQCTKCHDSHFSGKAKLFNDGHEGDTAIVSTDCTTVCHQVGDQYNNYTKYGHGKALSTYKYKGGVVDYTAGSNYISMGMACTACHGSLDTSDTSVSRKAHAEKTPSGTTQEVYVAKFNLDLSVQSFDTGSIYGNPLSGVCYSCHSTYATHNAGPGVAGCQDCHDEHGEGSGSASNYFMIPELAKKTGTYLTSPARTKTGTESIIYNAPRLLPATGALNTGNIDYYSAGATGVCDSTECHGAAGYAPLSTFAASHSGGASAIATGADCSGCHAHQQDGFIASPDSCANCHSYPGVATTNADHLLSGVHNRHVEPSPTGMGYACDTCHFGYNHNQSAYSDNSNNWTDVTVAITNINVRFNTTVGKVNAGLTNLTYNGVEADSAAAPGVAANHNGTCALLLCHGNASPKQSDWTGTTETPQWGTTDPAALGCDACHNNPPATPTANNSHGAHVTTAGYACTACHTASTAATHVDGSVTLVGGLTYTGGRAVGDFNYGTCNTGSCHNNTSTVGNIAWNVAQSSCNQCHYVSAAAGGEDNWVGNDGTASKVVQSEYTAVGHGKTSGPAINLACTACHDMAAVHDFSAALNGAGNNPYRLTAGYTCSNTTPSCHTAGKIGPVTGVDISTVVAHDKALMGTDGKRTWPWTPECVNCHDPHGDSTNIAMIGNEIYDNKALPLLAPPAGITAENTAMVFTNTALGHGIGSYAYNASPFSNICQECHISAGTGMLSYLDNTNTSASAHPGAVGGNPGDCSGCHKHSSAFKPSGCSGCHGGGTVYWPDNAVSNRTAYPDRAGRHLRHMTVIGARVGYGAVPSNFSGAQQSFVCDFCHNDVNGVGGTNHYPGGYSKTDAPANVGSFLQMWGTWAADGGTAATYTAVTLTGDVPNANTGVCANLDCHNTKTNTTGLEWYGATAGGCLMCHTVAGTGTVDPNTGLHDTATLTNVRHDDSFYYNNGASLGSCITCHSTSPTTGTNAHYNGTNDASVTTADASDPRVNIVTAIGFSDLATPTCAPSDSGVTANCHFEQSRPAITKTWTRLWHENGASADGTQCKGCHGTFTQGFRTGMSPVHTSSFDGDATASEIRNNHDGGDASETAYNQCKDCHVYSNAAYLKAGETNNLGWLPAGTSTNHGDGKITMNSSLGYSSATTECGTNCHSPNTARPMGDSGWNVGWVAGPGLACTSCHDNASAPVAQGSPHTIYRSRSSAGALTTATGCTDCHPGGTRGGTHAKAGDANVVAIPNNAAVGISYTHSVDTGVSGFVLGGNFTTGTTEAEICWNCHGNGGGPSPEGQEVSEWGTNTDTNGASANFNFGTLTTQNWFTATWSSANFKYKRGVLTTAPTTAAAPANPGSKAADTGSTHSVNSAASAQGVDTAALIRCSYCHDVHEQANATGDTVAGKPYLRGSWKGNPYREDGAPRNDTGLDVHSWTARGNWGAVPRANTQYTEYGGYQIDQNNGSPAAGWTYTGTTGFGGLCALCHGATINAINQWPGLAWTSGANSHGAVVTGGTGPYFNLYSEARRHATVGYPTATNTGVKTFTTAPWMAAKHIGTANAAYTFRGTSGFKYQPTLGNSRPLYASAFNWGATVDNASTNVNYHRFSCSKCHNPHASRLPRLLITNCLDTAANTWEDPLGYTGASYSTENANVGLSNVTAAQNCHRRRDPRYNKTWTTYTGNTSGGSPTGVNRPDGWNTVSPW